jgi:RNA polymerase sigma factor (sigma-70 family)
MSEDSTMPKLSLIAGGGGARQQFERLVTPHYATLYRVAYRFTGSRHDAEDLVQETCARAYRNIERVAELDNPRTWLMCIMRRLFIDQTRRYDRSNIGGLDEGLDERLSSHEPGPPELMESELIARRVEGSWRKLGKEQRALLALHDVEGYSLAELQEITGLKIGTLKSRLHRARVKLGRMLQSEGDMGEFETQWRASS